MEDVWKHIKTRGLPTSEMGKCQEIYDVIETAGELGIKEDDLQVNNENKLCIFTFLAHLS